MPQNILATEYLSYFAFFLIIFFDDVRLFTGLLQSQCSCHPSRHSGFVSDLFNDAIRSIE